MATTTTEADKKSATTTDSPQTIGDGDQKVQIGIDPQALIDAARAANDADNKKTKKSTDDETTIRAVPALIGTTGGATTTAALAAGSTLGPIGLGAVAASAAVLTVGVLVRNHNNKKNSNGRGNGNGSGNGRGNARGVAGNTSSLFGSGGSSGRRSGGGSLAGGGSGIGGGRRRSGGGSALHGHGSTGPGSKTRKNKATTGHGAGGHSTLKKNKNGGLGSGAGHHSKSNGGQGKHDKKPRSYSSTAVPVGAKAKRGADLLAARKNGNGNLNGGKGKGGLGTNHTSKGTTRHALKKATGKAARATGRTLLKTPVGKMAKATGRGINKALGKPSRAVWNSRPVQSVRSAARRLARGSRKHLVVRPARAVARALSKLWRRIRPGRGTYAHAARTALVGLWSLTCGMLSLLLMFGWKKVKSGDGEDLLAGRITRRMWERLMKRSRARRDAARRAEGLTMSVNDPGNDAKAGAAKKKRKKSKYEMDAQQPLIDYLEIDTFPDMDRIAAEYRGLGDGIRSVRQAVAIIFARTDQSELPKNIQLAIEELFGALDAAASFADQLWVQFARVHRNDLARYDDPRVNERLWNVVPNRVRTDGGGVQNRPSQFAVACARMPEVYAKWMPTDLTDSIGAVSGLGASLNSIAAAVRRLHNDAAESQPVHDSIADMLNTLAANLASCASNAGRIADAMQAVLDEKARQASDAATESATAKK
ncbi:hypothetical protein AB0D90_21685 [Streptomyces althioticus]|uniref:hypothetical protein n=1 Tax=Streptomyces althioticus TaxID=83380 RepID=UPI0033E96FBA